MHRRSGPAAIREGDRRLCDWNEKNDDDVLNIPKYATGQRSTSLPVAVDLCESDFSALYRQLGTANILSNDNFTTLFTLFSVRDYFGAIYVRFFVRPRHGGARPCARTATKNICFWNASFCAGEAVRSTFRNVYNTSIIIDPKRARVVVRGDEKVANLIYGIVVGGGVPLRSIVPPIHLWRTTRRQSNWPNAVQDDQTRRILIISRRRPVERRGDVAGRSWCFIPARDRRTFRVRIVFSHAVTGRANEISRSAHLPFRTNISLRE